MDAPVCVLVNLNYVPPKQTSAKVLLSAEYIGTINHFFKPHFLQ